MITEKKGIFSIEYLKDFNATQAAIRAGYSEKTAYSQGQRLLKDVEVIELIEKGKKEIIGDATKDIIDNVKFWQDMRNDPEAPESARLKASELLGKYRTMFTEKLEVKQETTIDFTDKSIDELKEIING